MNALSTCFVHRNMIYPPIELIGSIYYLGNLSPEFYTMSSQLLATKEL